MEPPSRHDKGVIVVEFVPKFGFFVITPCKGSPHTLTIGGCAVWYTREEAETALGSL